MSENHVHLFAVQIRKLAAQHQTGRPLKEVKAEVDFLIQSIREALGPDKRFQIKIWSQLLAELEMYQNSRADPRWQRVISHAKFRVKSRKKTAIYYAEHINKL
ncbi:hypothetical protein ACCY16_20225 [Candidatus Pantoea formicae]|uniref:hypothetical protein n=1 Tax=Candidatus Pantoea formicae TaxID=2608355 RepID=UPI003ED890DF